MASSSHSQFGLYDEMSLYMESHAYEPNVTFSDFDNGSDDSSDSDDENHMHAYEPNVTFSALICY